MKYRLLLYNVKKRHKLIIRFRSYYKLSKWCYENIKEEDYKNFDIRKQYIKNK